MWSDADNSWGQSDERADNAVVLSLSAAVPQNASVAVATAALPGAYSTVYSPLQYSPAIHVDQEGYLDTANGAPALKQASVGYYLGTGGELPISATSFSVLSVTNGGTVYSGLLKARKESWDKSAPYPGYQQVYQADFSSLTMDDTYVLQVPGLGVSLPFTIGPGYGMDLVRTYAYGVYHQRSGSPKTLPWTRYNQPSGDHLQATAFPAPGSWTFTNMAGQIGPTGGGPLSPSPPNGTMAMTAAQAAPDITSSLNFPYIESTPRDASGGYWDAGDYSLYMPNIAYMVHAQLFAVDNFPIGATLSNLGLPQSGGPVPDLVAEAFWGVSQLAKMQDPNDGNFYELRYPSDQNYETVLPETVGPTVFLPKTTVATAAGCGALAEAASSPAMLKYYPAQAAAWMSQATAAWNALQADFARYPGASYQQGWISSYGADWQDADEYYYAAAAMYAATGDVTYLNAAKACLPDPSSTNIQRWGWWGMVESWGLGIRAIAFAQHSGRLSAPDAAYSAACQAAVISWANTNVGYSAASSYGTPYPIPTKDVFGGGWWYSLDEAFDVAVANVLSPSPAYLNCLINASNFTNGRNPVNVSYTAGLGMKRLFNYVSQWQVSYHTFGGARFLPPIGRTSCEITNSDGNCQGYSDFDKLSVPSDSLGSYPLMDRGTTDTWNPQKEQECYQQVHALICALAIAEAGPQAPVQEPWTAPADATVTAAGSIARNQPVTFTVSVPGQDLAGARVLLEPGNVTGSASPTQPLAVWAPNGTGQITFTSSGPMTVEAEVQWNDGRRAFARTTVTVP
jgi:hypothetical protein